MEIDTTGAVSISGHLYEYVDVLKNKVFLDSDKKTIHQFALAVGIAADRKLPRSKFEKGGEDNKELYPGSQLATHDNIEAIVTLLDLQGNIGQSKPNEIVSEYINGGLELLEGMSFESQNEESREKFLQEFPHLISEE